MKDCIQSHDNYIILFSGDEVKFIASENNTLVTVHCSGGYK